MLAKIIDPPPPPTTLTTLYKINTTQLQKLKKRDVVIRDEPRIPDGLLLGSLDD